MYSHDIFFCDGCFQCVMVTGEHMHSGNLHILVPDYDVLVLTPKILENHLHPDKIPSLDVFSLIIFDECHHTRKGEPYNSVMKNYLKSKKSGENLPQVWALAYIRACAHHKHTLSQNFYCRYFVYLSN